MIVKKIQSDMVSHFPVDPRLQPVAVARVQHSKKFQRNAFREQRLLKENRKLLHRFVDLRAGGVGEIVQVSSGKCFKKL